MSSLPVVRPNGSPSCWGYKYQDGDQECAQCPFNDSCRKEVLRGAISSPVTAAHGAPMTTPQVPYTHPGYFAAPPSPYPPLPPAQMSPVFRPPAPPPVPMHPVTSYQYPQPVPVSPPVQQAFQPQQQYYHASLPLEVPDPTRPWVRPGTTAPYYFTQYPGESISTRLGKNLVLKALEGICKELVSFFGQWTWPRASRDQER